MKPDSLRLWAKNANTGDACTLIHWGFLNIDANAWTLAIQYFSNQLEISSLEKCRANCIVWLPALLHPAIFNIVRPPIIENLEYLLQYYRIRRPWTWWGEYQLGMFNFCPEPLYMRKDTSPPETRLAEIPDLKVLTIDDFHLDLRRLCMFTCKHDRYSDSIYIPVPPKDNETEFKRHWDLLYRSRTRRVN